MTKGYLLSEGRTEIRMPSLYKRLVIDCAESIMERLLIGKILEQLRDRPECFDIIEHDLQELNIIIQMCYSVEYKLLLSERNIIGRILRIVSTHPRINLSRLVYAGDLLIDTSIKYTIKDYKWDRIQH